ncbi:putative membrane protein [Synechococcus sp. PROS-U-1]|nr:putative membrane protein [Synechococcus sp. PROS-U-1]
MRERPSVGDMVAVGISVLLPGPMVPVVMVHLKTEKQLVS